MYHWRKWPAEGKNKQTNLETQTLGNPNNFTYFTKFHCRVKWSFNKPPLYISTYRMSIGCSIVFFFFLLLCFNCLVEIQFTYHKIHSFPVYNSVIFSAFTEMWNHQHNQLWKYFLYPKGNYSLAFTPHFIPIPAALGNH